MQLEFKTLNLRLAHTWNIARTRATDTAQVVVVGLSDDHGANGKGEASPVARYGESPRSVEGFLKQVDPTRLKFDDLTGSMEYVESIAPDNRAAKCAINIALVDGAARRRRQSAHEILGLSFQDGRYVSSFTIGIDVPQVIHKKVLAADCFPILKMKVGVPSDKANLEALRSVAPTKTVRVDANEGWRTKEQALEMIEWISRDRNVQFIEQPLPASTSTKDWIWLKERSPLPIFADESYHTAADVDQAASCFHGVNVKLVKAGGITGAFEALSAARKAGLKTMLGCMIETSILISAAAHLAGLCDYLDLDGNLLITNDPYIGVSATNGILSFASSPERYGIRVAARD